MNSKRDLVNEYKSESVTSSSSQRSSSFEERRSKDGADVEKINVVKRDRDLRKTFSNVGGATVELLTGLLQDTY